MASKSIIDDFIRGLKGSSLGRQVVHHGNLPAREARTQALKRPWPGEVEDLLAGAGLKALYSHQARAMDLVRAGRHVVVATPTASGKTLIYNLPFMERALDDPSSRALYLFPLKALAQDQLRVFEGLAAGLSQDAAPLAAIYDGDTSAYRRRRLRELPPNVLLTNPEMLNLSLLAHHHLWETFWKGLTHVVVDEVHTYRGVMGSHMAWVFRRMRRICDFYGARPTFVFCSATIGNPAELASQLTGLDVEAVTESGAPSGRRHVLFLNPDDGAAQAAIQLLKAALPLGLRTIVYTQSRKLTELIGIWVREKAGPYADRISSYRAGFLPEERRQIEAKLSSGELLAVISTSALELGIDIGSLDLCILVGYPGTVMATWQRGGRVGRAQQDSALVLVAQEDALDQYFMRHPRDLLKRPPESAVVNPDNPVIMRRHLACAAAERPLAMDEGWVHGKAVSGVLRSMEAEGEILRSADGEALFSARKNPQRGVDLRGSGQSFHILSAADGVTVGEIDGFRAYRETHPGAVYLHRGETFVVDDLDLNDRTARVSRKDVDYFTRVRAEKTTEILEASGQRTVLGTRLFWGRLRVTDQVNAFERRRVRGQRLMNVVPLDLPPQVFETEGVWIEIPRAVQMAAEGAYMHFMGGIHAVEHAAIGILPLLILADRNDLGGISTPHHPQVGGAAVFIYDAAPGGVGLSRAAFRRAEEVLHRTREAIQSCPCETGCPSCVHSPKCGSGNRPIDKKAALFVLEGLISGVPEDRPLSGPAPRPASPAEPPPRRGQAEAVSEPAPSEPPPIEVHYGVLDLETQLSAQEVGGWHRADLMKISCAVLYDSKEEAFLRFSEAEIPALVNRLAGLELVVGFNINRFDYKVLGAYTDRDLHTLPTLDILERVHQQLGYRLSLDHLASGTLEAQKTGNGLLALKWWREGRMEELMAYCEKDVRLTRDLFLYGRRHGYLLFRNKAGQKVRLPVSW